MVPVLAFFLGYIFYVLVRLLLLKYTDIKLDIIPDRYPDDPKRTWQGAGTYMACYLIAGIILMILENLFQL